LGLRFQRGQGVGATLVRAALDRAFSAGVSRVLVATATADIAAGDGLSLLTWERDTFAYADSYDEATARYRGLRLGQSLNLGDGNSGLLVKPEAARKQAEAERPTAPPPTDKRTGATEDTNQIASEE
jgi:predicted lipoprotein with Yx(FWY)xxD motif